MVIENKSRKVQTRERKAIIEMRFICAPLTVRRNVKLDQAWLKPAPDSQFERLLLRAAPCQEGESCCHERGKVKSPQGRCSWASSKFGNQSNRNRHVSRLGYLILEHLNFDWRLADGAAPCRSFFSGYSSAEEGGAADT